MRFAATPWLWLVPALAFLWLGLRFADARRRAGLRRLLGAAAPAHVEQRHGALLAWDRFLLLAGLFWLLVALARPQWGASEVTVTQQGSDVVVVLDISNSMLAQDVAPSRLERAKTELGSFLGRVQDSRIGLVFFAGAAFVQCPLTLDYGTADMFLRMADTDMLSEQGTNIGAALATARQLLAKGRGGEAGEGFQAILLVTDGEDLEGQWEQEAEACRKEGIRVIPVGVGSAEGGLIPAVDRAGRPAGFLKDDEGNVVTTHLNVTALEKLGSLGDTGTFRLGVDGLAGDRLYRELQRLGRRDLEDRRVSAYQERYVWPLSLAIGWLLLRLGLRPWRRAGALLALLALLSATEAPAAPALVRDGAAAAAEGKRLYGKGDYAGALSAFEGAVVQAPEDPRIPFWAAGVINGVGHFWGYRNYDCADASTNILPWGILIGGEELHNNHHAYATSARLSSKWYEFDIGWLYIRLLEILGQARVKKVAPRLRLAAARQTIDLDNLQAVITHRYDVMAKYMQSLRQIYREEAGKLKASLDAKSLKALKRWLARDAEELPEQERQRYMAALEKSSRLSLGVEMRHELVALWQRSTATHEELLARLQDWCRRAEASGIRQLEEFSSRLRRYAL